MGGRSDRGRRRGTGGEVEWQGREESGDKRGKGREISPPLSFLKVGAYML